MYIRTEVPADILPIAELLKSCFETDAESRLVSKLRENGKITLSLVACDDETGELIGHVLFSPMTIQGQETLWQGLAPVATVEQHRGKGVASALIEEGIQTLKELGYQGSVVLGDPKFYGRLGYLDAESLGIKCQWPEYQSAFQAMPFSQENRVTGEVFYSDEFLDL